METNSAELPFLSCPSPWGNIHFKIPFVEDLDDLQFGQKFFASDYNVGASEKVTTSAILSTINLVKCDVLESLEIWPAQWHFNAQALSVKGLQISTVEPWNNLMFKETSPCNIIYEELDRLNSISPSLPVDDPLKSTLPPLVPSKFPETTETTLQFSVPLELSNLCLKEIIYPDTFSCEICLDRQESKEVDSPGVTFLAKFLKSKKSDSSDITLVRVCSKTDPDNLSQKIDELKLAKVGGVIPPKERFEDIDIITVDLPGFSLDIINVMESYLRDCLENAMRLNLPPLVFNLLKNKHAVADLQPSVTRLCLVRVKEEITKMVKEFPQLNCKKQAKEILESSLPTMLSLHGVNKAIDIFLNVDFNYAFKSLSDFLQTHEQVLKPSDFESFLHRLSPLIPNDSEIIHPKLMELRKQVLKYLEAKRTDYCKVFIRLIRHSDVIAPQIHSIMTAAGLHCIVDPRIWRCSTPQTFHGGQTVIVAEKIASDFSCNLISLVINYERPSAAIPHLSTVPQLTLDVHRPLFDDKNETLEIEEIPVCSLTSSCTSSSLKSSGSSPDMKNLVKDDEKSKYKRSEKKQIPDAEKMKMPIQKDLNTEIAIHRNSDSNHVEILPAPLSNSTKQRLISEPIESQVDRLLLQPMQQGLDTRYSSTANCVSISDVTPLPIKNPFSKTGDVILSPTINSVYSDPHETERVLPIICTSRFVQNVELMNAISEKDLQVHEFDYSFLGSISTFQPDVLISAQTAVLIVSVNDSEDLKKLRMKVLLASYKCTKCWIIVMAPDMISTSKLPNIWHSMYGLSRFYDKKEHNELGIPFQLKLHLAFNFSQVARIMKNIVLDELDGTVGDIYSDLQPTCHEAKLILHFHQFNVVTAQLVADHVTAFELLHLDKQILVSRIPLQKLRKKVQIFRAAIESSTKQVSDVTNSPYGHLKSYFDDDTEDVMIKLLSPKRARLDYENQLLQLDQVEDLIEMWKSPNLFKQ